MKTDKVVKTGFDIILGTFVMLLLGTSLGYPYKLRLFPLIIGIPTLLVFITIVVKDLRDLKTQREIGNEKTSRYEEDKWSPVLKMMGWVSLGALAMLLLGWFVFLFGFTFLFLFLEGKMKWGKSLMLTILFSLIMFYLFDYVLQVPSWLGLVPEIVPKFIGGAVPPPFFF